MRDETSFRTVFEMLGKVNEMYFVLTCKDVSSVSQLYNAILTYEKLQNGVTFILRHLIYFSPLLYSMVKTYNRALKSFLSRIPKLLIK